ncbi:MAG TPA: peptidoglycan editing factor PgeF [Vicinamibacterales bacterium]|nr:peptidoglycan editing factor PgeF [Vicinamibacterales bacterium]
MERVAQHLFTTKQLQLRPFERQTEAWAAAASAVGGALGDLRRIKQVHGRTVRVVRADDMPPIDPPPEADASVSNTPGHVLAVQVADCVPLLLADPCTGAVGAVHAGWRGSAARIAGATVQTLAQEFGVRPGDLIAAVGPSIGTCCYEVGSELLDAFRQAGAGNEELDRWFMRTDAGSLRLDLWNVTRDHLIEAGIHRDRIYLSRLCTQTHAALFESYRAQGPNAGRMAALIRVPPRPTEGTMETMDTMDDRSKKS